VGALPGELRDLLAAELNVHAVESLGPADLSTGWSVATASGATVALDLTVTPALRAEGLAREVTRRIQQARKAHGLAMSDQIAVRWDAPGRELSSALAEHGEMIAGEVQAIALEPRDGGPGADCDTAGPGRAGSGRTGIAGEWHEHHDEALGLRFWLAVARAPRTGQRA
jgi:hypothetical protein